MYILKRLLLASIPALLCAASNLAIAQSNADTDADSDQTVEQYHHHHRRHENGGDDVVEIGSDAHLAAGNHANSVVAILGSATSDGHAGEVVSVIGSTHVTGPVNEDVIAVLGSNYIDSEVHGDAVAVFGDLELGPHAEIGGDVVTVGGKLTRDPAAIVHGETQTVLPLQISGHFQWLRTWARECLFYGRPLAVAPGLGWAWILALSFLVLYLLMALLFPRAVTRCAETFESQPGHSLLAAVLGALLSPIAIVVLCITVIGIAAVPFLIIGLMGVALFGKAIMLAWLGRRCLAIRHAGQTSAHPALAVAIGGVIVLVLYLVPVVGLLVYKIFGFLGFGVVLLTLLQAIRSRRAEAGPAEPLVGAATAGSAVDPAAAAAPAQSPIAVAALPRAGFWIRMAALLLDIVLVGIVLYVLDHLANMELVVLAAYGAVMWKLRGSTIGGIVFDLQVVRHDGREIDWPTAIVRALGCFLSLAAVGIGFLWIAFDSNKLAWHDKIAGTMVVRTNKRISLV